MVKKTSKFSWFDTQNYHADEEMRQKHIRKVAENRAICSCDMCGNPRRNGWSKGEKLTIHERKIIESEKYQE